MDFYKPPINHCAVQNLNLLKIRKGYITVDITVGLNIKSKHTFQIYSKTGKLVKITETPF